MCNELWKAQLLLLLLMSLHSVSVCLAYNCRFDKMMEEVNPLKIAMATDQPTVQEWEPLRIVASTDDFQGPSKYCRTRGDSTYASAKDAATTCDDLFSTLTLEQIRTVMGVVERAITLHTDRLLVQRTKGPLKIPDFSSYEYCKYFNVPAKHHNPGVASADMVLYVAFMGDLDYVRTLSFGLTCAKSAGGRPIAGGLAVGSDSIEISRHTVRFAAHQIAHALGFSYSEMNARNMIINKRNVRGKPNPVAIVKSDKTKGMTQAHYGCPEADGMELEDGADHDEAQSHWERRNAKDELMAQLVGGPGASFMGFYTNITLAAFEDMGVFKANFRMAEHMVYGYKTGCDFLTGKCIENGVTRWPSMFCSGSFSDRNKKICSTDRVGLGGCWLHSQLLKPLPTHFQYFESNKTGGFNFYLTDYCPVVEQDGKNWCKKSKSSQSILGSILGENSMCLDGSALRVKLRNGTVIDTDAVCAEISCEGGSVRAKYHGDTDNKWHACPQGGSLTPSKTSASFVSGTIKCPKYQEVCTIASDGRSLVARDTKRIKGLNSKDSSSVTFGLISSVAVLGLSFSGYIIA